MYIYGKSAFDFLCAQPSCHQRIEPWRQNAFLDLYDRLEPCGGCCCAVAFRRCRCPPAQSCWSSACPHAPYGERFLDTDVSRLPLDFSASLGGASLVGSCEREQPPLDAGLGHGCSGGWCLSLFSRPGSQKSTDSSRVPNSFSDCPSALIRTSASLCWLRIMTAETV